MARKFPEMRTMNKQQFDVTAEIEFVQQKRSDRRRKKYRSRLCDYRTEIIEFLKNDKSSYRLIAEWLRTKKKYKVSHTTVMRYAKTLKVQEGEQNG